MKKIIAILTFTKPERNGLIVLSVALILFTLYFLFRGSSADLIGDLPLVQSETSQKSSDTFERIRKEKPEHNYVSLAGNNSVYQQKELFFFNPNTITEDEWIRLGFSPAQAQSIIKFRTKGGNFTRKEDLRKLYVVSPERYAELEPYITIPMDTVINTIVVKPAIPVVIELNTADTALLSTLHGIGSVFALRIVMYRELLGGFHHKQQLLEVFGMDQEKYSVVEARIKVDSTYIRKINVNQATASDLKKHPYISPGVANALINYRKAHGAFRHLSDIMKCHLVNAELYRKIAPYLTI